MPAEEVLSKQGEPIEPGDHVYTKIRGGRHEGDVRYLAFLLPLTLPLSRSYLLRLSEYNRLIDS